MTTRGRQAPQSTQWCWIFELRYCMRGIELHWALRVTRAALEELSTRASSPTPSTCFVLSPTETNFESARILELTKALRMAVIGRSVLPSEVMFWRICMPSEVTPMKCRSIHSALLLEAHSIAHTPTGGRAISYQPGCCANKQPAAPFSFSSPTAAPPPPHPHPPASWAPGSWTPDSL
jgi:hypothetical protein